MNLDPFNKHGDDQLWRALEHAHLRNFVDSTTMKLEHPITEGGENLSVGQRQVHECAR